MLLPSAPTGRRIYEEVWAVAHNLLHKNSKFLKKENLWWNQKDWPKEMANRKEEKGLKPFVIKMVDRQGFSCS